MSENCTHDCSTCSADCASRDLRVPANALSSVKRVIGVVSGKGGVGKSTENDPYRRFLQISMPKGRFRK